MGINKSGVFSTPLILIYLLPPKPKPHPHPPPNRITRSKKKNNKLSSSPKQPLRSPIIKSSLNIYWYPKKSLGTPNTLYKYSDKFVTI